MLMKLILSAVFILSSISQQVIALSKDTKKSVYIGVVIDKSSFKKELQFTPHITLYRENITKDECDKNIEQICQESFQVAEKLTKQGKIYWEPTEKLEDYGKFCGSTVMFKKKQQFTHAGKFIIFSDKYPNEKTPHISILKKMDKEKKVIDYCSLHHAKDYFKYNEISIEHQKCSNIVVSTGQFSNEITNQKDFCNPKECVQYFNSLFANHEL